MNKYVKATWINNAIEETSFHPALYSDTLKKSNEEIVQL